MGLYRSRPGFAPFPRLMFEDFYNTLIDALLAFPPARFVLGLVGSRWQPLWAGIWLAGLAYVIARALNALVVRRARVQELARHANPYDAPQIGTGHREGSAKERRPTASPRAAPARSTPALHVPHRDLRTLVRVVGVSVVLAASVTFGVALLLNKDSAPRTALADSTPPARTPATSFAFDWRVGRMVDGACVMTFEVTAGTPVPWQVAVQVMDSVGHVVGTDSQSVPSLAPGLHLDFRFPRVACDTIQTWQFQGAPRS